MDRLTEKERSINMSKIRGKDTNQEILVRRFLFSKGFRFRKNDKRHPGRPDIVLPKYKTVIFVNGCFWHCHEGCRDFTIPKTNVEFWTDKLNANKLRDKRNHDALIKSGWKVIIIWECELTRSKQADTLKELLNRIKIEIR